MKKLSFNIIANAVVGYEGLSGGDNIFINFAKQLVKKGIEVNIFTWKHGLLMCQRNELRGVNFFLSEAGKYERLPFPLLYFLRTFSGVKKIDQVIKSGYFKNKEVVVYSASDFYPDSIPGFFFKKKISGVKWLASLYLFAPNPLRGFRGELKLKNLFFWLSQQPIFWLIKKSADMVCVTSQPDVRPFVKSGKKKSEVFVVKGGIDYQHLRHFQKPIAKIYDAVYVGRFHPQKGVLEMIDIWRQVVNSRPKAKLAIIGLGEMEEAMKKRVGQHALKKNVEFLGVMIGDDRNKILQKSKIILHPAVYDSGGMAAASGLALGLPGVSFDLPVFKSYYPLGFLRAKVADANDFAQKIILLLKDARLYRKMSLEAITEAKTWDWENRVNCFMAKVNEL